MSLIRMLLWCILQTLQQEAIAAPPPPCNCATKNVESRELSPSFCPNRHSVVIWKDCPHPMLRNCTEGFLSVPSVGVGKKLQLRLRKKGLRSNEIFQMKRSQSLSTGRGTPFYSLRTADNLCVDVDTNGHLIVAKNSGLKECRTNFRYFISSVSALSASPTRICAVKQANGRASSAYVLGFNKDEQIPLRLASPGNCTLALQAGLDEPLTAAQRIGNILGLTDTANDSQKTAFRWFYIFNSYGSFEWGKESLSSDIAFRCNFDY